MLFPPAGVNFTKQSLDELAIFPRIAQPRLQIEHWQPESQGCTVLRVGGLLEGSIADPLRPGITFTYLGVRVNERAEVQGFRNIFAAGEIMAGNVVGKGYLAGLGMTIGSVFGRIAGREAALAAAR